MNNKNKLKTNDYEIVFSDDPSLVKCKKCKKLNCVCAEDELVDDVSKIRVKISKETSGRAGKTVTLIRKLPSNQQFLNNLLKKIKQHCGTGGTLKEEVLEIQGDHVENVKKFLNKLGFKI